MLPMLAFDWPSPWVLLVIVGAILLLYGIFAPQKRPVTSVAPPSSRAYERSGNGTTTRLRDATPETIDVEPLSITIAEDDIELGPVIAHPPAPTWTTLIDERQSGLDVATRRSIILGLGALAQPWCAQILTRAYDEEATIDMRSTVLGAIRDGRYSEGIHVLERALHSNVEQERVLAVEGLGAIGEWQPLETALADESLGVASAAAYQLLRARGFDEAAAMIHASGGPHASELESIMAIFA